MAQRGEHDRQSHYAGFVIRQRGTIMTDDLFKNLAIGLKEAADYARGKAPALVARYEDGKLISRKWQMADGKEVSAMIKRTEWREWLQEQMEKARVPETDLYDLDYRHEMIWVRISDEKLKELVEIDLDLIRELKKLGASGILSHDLFSEIDEEAENSGRDPVVEHTLLAFGKDGILDRPALQRLVNRVGILEPNGYPYGSAAWLLLARGAVCSGVYAVAAVADQLEDDNMYVSCLWYFLRSMLNYGWNTVPENE